MMLCGTVEVWTLTSILQYDDTRKPITTKSWNPLEPHCEVMF